jgi:hypothetical protein
MLSAMGSIRIVSLLVYAFGVFAYGATLALWMRQWRLARHDAEVEAPSRLDGVMSLVSLAWFVVSFALAIVSYDPSIRDWGLLSVLLVLAFLYPPLIMHVSYSSTRESGQIAGGTGWWLPVPATYAVSLALALTCVAGFWELVPVAPAVVSMAANLGPGALFLVAGIYTFYAISRPHPAPRSAVERRADRPWLLLFALLVALAVLMLLAGLGVIPFGPLFELALRSTPLLFLLAGTDCEDRVQFFDIFGKRGLALLATALVLAAALALVLPVLARFHFGMAEPVVYALVLLPAAAAVPWLHRSIGRIVDRFWLGRPYAARSRQPVPGAHASRDERAGARGRGGASAGVGFPRAGARDDRHAGRG